MSKLNKGSSGVGKYMKYLAKNDAVVVDQTSNHCTDCERLEKENRALMEQIEKWRTFYGALAPSHMVFGGYVDKEELARSVGLEV